MGLLDLNAIRESVQTILEGQNTTGASFHDLSSNMSTRVQHIYKMNPSKITPQASKFPCVCIYSAGKNITPDTIAKDQVTAKRNGIYTMHITGLVFNANMSSFDEDPADEDAERLLENIEYILRNYPTFDGASNVRWQVPTDSVFFDTVLEETTHLRAGVLTYQVNLRY